MVAPLDSPVSHFSNLFALARGLHSVYRETFHRMEARNSGMGSMNPHLNSRSAIAARSTMSGGAIAGTVIGTIVAVTFISVVIGFLYFRWKRQSHSVTDDGDKPTEIERRLSLPGPDPSAGQTHFIGGPYAQPWTGDAAQFGQTGPVWAPVAELQQQSLAGNDSTFANHQQPTDFSQEPGAIPTAPHAYEEADGIEYVPPGAPLEGGAADYYNTDIAMDSEPEQAPSGPTRQMTELYEEQLRKTRDSRKNSKGSTWSWIAKGFMSKRKRSTHASEVTSMEEGQAQPSSNYNPDIPITSKEPTDPQATAARGFAPDADLFEEPQEMSDSSHVDLHTSKRTKRRGPSGDTSGVVPHRLDSLRRDSTLDSQLPSAAFRQSHIPADKSIAKRQLTRFQSPELPEPMEIDDSDLIGRDGTSSVVRGSHSPPLDAAGFSAVNPMDIMRPSNAAEKAVFTNAELNRIASTSVSPPTSPPYNGSPPPPTNGDETAATGLDLEEADHADESEYDEYDDEDEDDLEEQSHEPTYEDVPQIAVDEAFVTDGPSDWSTPAETTDPSTGRTPGTDITSSPSPAPSTGAMKADGGIPPLDQTGSPRPLLTCEECGRTFDQIHKLNHHKRYHDRRHVCTYPDCGKKFGTKTHLDRHINDKHEKKKGFHCTEEGCLYFKGGKSFPRKDNWRRHMLNKHGITPTMDPQPAE